MFNVRLDSRKEEVLKIFRSYDLMVGHNSQDGSLILPILLDIASSKGELLDHGADRETGDLFLENHLHEYFPNCPEIVALEIKNKYLCNGDFTAGFTASNADTILTIYSDLLYTSPALATLDVHCNHGNNRTRRGSTYMYRFDLETQKARSWNPVW